MTSERSRGLPIFHDDLTFHDRHERAFEEMQRRFDEDFGRRGFGRSFDDPWNWHDDLDRLCTDFHKLKPRSRLGNLEESGSRDSLDDVGAAPRNAYVEHPQTKSRTFHMSFDVRDYRPSDITVKTDGGTLVITARHEDDVDGRKNVREFSRRIKIPSDVDAEKLTSTLSHDGILTVHAPVPPKYASVAYVSSKLPSTSASASVGTAASGAQLPRSTPGERDLSRASSGVTPTAARTADATPTPTSTAGEPPPLFDHTTSLAELPLDTPTFRDWPDGGGREFQLAIEVPRPFTPDDVVVKLEGRSLHVEATHEEKSQAKTATSSMNRSFELAEDLDPASVEAMLRSDGCLLIKGRVKRNT